MHERRIRCREIALRDIGATGYIAPHAVEIRRAFMALLTAEQLVPFAKDLVDNPRVNHALFAAINRLGRSTNARRAALCRFGCLRIAALQHARIAHEI